MKYGKYYSIAVAILMIAGLLTAGCSLGFQQSTGTVKLSLTDAPIADASDVEGVFITIESIMYNIDDEWVTMEGFEGPQEFNLLELTGGEVAVLGEAELPAGRVAQIRFMLGAPEEGERIAGTPGSYIAVDPDGETDGDAGDDVKYPLFVPSGSQSGYKAVGGFDVPANGTVEITADFDVRKSVLLTGNSEYILKPTIRLVVNDQAGSITGDFDYDTENTDYESYVVFAYEDDTYTSEEAAPADPDVLPFSNAVGSGNAVDTGDDDLFDTYTVAFLAAGTYDLVVAGVDGDGEFTVLSETDYADVTVQADVSTDQDVDVSTTP